MRLNLTALRNTCRCLSFTSIKKGRWGSASWRRKVGEQRTYPSSKAWWNNHWTKRNWILWWDIGGSETEVPTLSTLTCTTKMANANANQNTSLETDADNPAFYFFKKLANKLKRGIINFSYYEPLNPTIVTTCVHPPYSLPASQKGLGGNHSRRKTGEAVLSQTKRHWFWRYRIPRSVLRDDDASPQRTPGHYLTRAKKT